MIEIKSLQKTFPTKEGDVEALKGIDLTIKDGDIFGIIGTSGAGKSTLVRCINMLEKPNSGQILIDGIDVTKLNKKELNNIRHSVSMIFQHFNLLMQKNCLDNVVLPMLLSGVKKDEAYKRASELLETVGLKDKEKAYPAQLSGGQQQRVAIARALSTDPKVLLCDEATSALDTATTNAILDLIRDINSKLNITVIIITHQMSVVENICHHVAILDEGRIVEQGEVGEVFAQPKTNAARRLVFPEGNDDSIIAARENEHFIRVVFNGANTTKEPLIATMAKEEGIVANIAYASTRGINGKVYGSMLLGVIGEDDIVERTINYLTKVNDIVAQEVTIHA